MKRFTADEEGVADLAGAVAGGVPQDVLEAGEAERLAVVVERLDEAVAVEDEPVAGVEPRDVLDERLAPLHAEREAPRREGLDRSPPPARTTYGSRCPAEQ